MGGAGNTFSLDWPAKVLEATQMLGLLIRAALLKPFRLEACASLTSDGNVIDTDPSPVGDAALPTSGEMWFPAEEDGYLGQ
jgi:hypothetical protein